MTWQKTLSAIMDNFISENVSEKYWQQKELWKKKSINLKEPCARWWPGIDLDALSSKSALVFSKIKIVVRKMEVHNDDPLLSDGVK